jgi:hypothetical protein
MCGLNFAVLRREEGRVIAMLYAAVLQSPEAQVEELIRQVF